MSLNIPVKSAGDQFFAEEVNELVSATNLLLTNTPLTNVTHINELADFPTPVGGVIELVQAPGESRTYVIAADNIDVGSNVFTVTNGDIVIRGVHRTASQITTTGNTTMFTSIDSNFFCEFIGFTCSDAKWLDWSVPGMSALNHASQNAIIYDCDVVATIDGAFTTSLRTFTVVNATTNGILWTGIHSQVNISQMLGISWAGTLLDLGTATFEIINITPGNRFISPSGTVILNGAASSANLVTGGRAIVSGNLFNGIGTAITGIDTQDIQWTFSDNVFADNTTLNTIIISNAYLNGAFTVSVAAADTYYAMSSVNWVGDLLSGFSMDANGVLEYLRDETLVFGITVVTTLEKTGGGSNKICTRIGIDSGSGFVTFQKTMGCTQNSTPTEVTSVGIFSVAKGDKIQPFTANIDGTSDIIISESTIIINAI